MLDILPGLKEIRFEQLTGMKIRTMQMFYVTVWEKYVESFDNDEVQQNLLDLADSQSCWRS